MAIKNMNNQDSSKDQRSNDRIIIPGATVIFRKRNILGIFERYSRPMQLFNMTKSGLCFRSTKRLRLGEELYVDILIPGEKTLRIIGQVRWIDDELSDDTCLIGAQFIAFGRGRNYNSFKILERLRKLQSKYI